MGKEGNRKGGKESSCREAKIGDVKGGRGRREEREEGRTGRREEMKRRKSR